MKRKHYLLDLFGGVADRFVVEAVESREAAAPVRRKSRVFLIAAVIALALLLMGCVAVFLGLQQRKIGELPVTQKFDAYGSPVDEPEKTWYIASMSGFDNSPAQQASREWNEFLRTYEPPVITNDPDLPEIPNQYEYTYNCIDQTMVAKLLEIAEKYDLELLGTRAIAQAWQREAAFETLGLTRLVLEDAPAKADYGACQVYPPYHFICDVRLTLTGADAPWTEEAYCELYYLQSGYLASQDAFLYDPETTQEWEYTTADGTKVLLALSGADGTVLAQREDCTIVIRMDLAWQQGVFLDEDTPLPSREALEHLADCFDYSITTQAAPMEGLQAEFDAIPDPHSFIDDDYEPPQYASYAAFLNENYLWPELVEYAFYDIDGDGEQDLITSYGDGFCINWLSIRDGQVMDISGGRGAMRLCEGGIAENHDGNDRRRFYLKIIGPDPVTGTEMEHLHSVTYGEGQWRIDEDFCTEQEAADFMAQYRPLPLDWQPLVSFPMDDQGTTFGDILAREGAPTGDALLQFYGANYTVDQDYWNRDIAWFDIRDINGDGIDDLLLSGDGEMIDMAYTCKRGELVSLQWSFYLCQDNYMHETKRRDSYFEGVVEQHHFSKLTGSDITFWYQLTHNLSTGVWTDTYYTEISEAEAQAILANYPHVALNMRPISELSGK